MGLELVKPLADAGDLSPLLADAMVRHQVRPDGLHEFNFDTEFDGPALAGALALSETVVFGGEAPDLSKTQMLRAVRAGLRTLTYPNSRIMRKGARYVDRDARRNLLQARPDTQALLAGIDFPEHHRMVPAMLTFYSEKVAGMETDLALRNLKREALKELCTGLGISFDELALQRRKGQNRDTVDAVDYVFDMEELEARYRLRRFKPTIVLPEEENDPWLTDADDWPKGGWAEKADKVQQLRLVELQDAGADLDSMGLRWQTLIRDDTAPRHVVRPQLLVRSDTEKRNEEIRRAPRAFHVWTRPETCLDFTCEPPEYDLATHTVTHTSPVLGAVLLMNGLAQPAHLRRTLHKALFGKSGHAADGRDAVPEKAFGLAPLIVQNRAVQYSLLKSSGFRRLAENTESGLR